MTSLELFVTKRNKNLEHIAKEQVMDLHRGNYIQARELMDIMFDNSVTDAYMERYFDLGFLAMPAQVEELHLKRCENSAVEFCICMPDKQSNIIETL